MSWFEIDLLLFIQDLQPELIQTNKTLAAINTNIEKLVKVSKSALSKCKDGRIYVTWILSTLEFLVNSQRVTAVSGGNHQPSLLRDTQQISAGVCS